MTKLPDNPELLKLYRNGFSDKEIAEMFGATVQAVNLRLSALGIKRAPYRTAAKEILEAAWPSSETRRTEFVHLNRARDLYVFLRRQLGDRALTKMQLTAAARFERLIRDNEAVLDLQPDAPDGPWVLVPRKPSDGAMVIRWPEGRELPDGKLREALDLPAAPES
ncbi:hypothetical protein [Streptomyces sp. NBC_01751]|uniref:hypothetical protein n=1 Tax=Streptomyces sp. NBC_01751 TaxID=2975929 RepID=UPI002DD7DAD4|nr:hypothetical protein [Streptomyces sp. NBC_01751]WSD24538.1 hypothetical protein OHA26_14175 [Streptomyces sp. NBC_01751]